MNLKKIVLLIHLQFCNEAITNSESVASNTDYLHPWARCVLQMNETYQHPEKWHEFILQPPHDETFTHVMSHNIRGLDPGSVFEAIVQAKNRYGWNEVSDLYQFYTRGAGVVYST